MECLYAVADLMGKDEKPNLLEMGNLNPPMQALFTSFVGSSATEMALNYESVQNLLKSNEKFDLVIVEMFYTELLWGFAHRFDCPLLVLSTLGKTNLNN